MPLPLAPLLPLVFRLGAVATTTYALAALVKARAQPGRTDQRAEDALDDLGEGLAAHKPQDRAGEGVSQTNTTGRMVRVISIGKRRIEVDAAFIARFRVRKGG
jgi:hypothetical protein